MEAKCGICLAPMDAKCVEDPISVLPCMHSFHTDCIEAYISQNTTADPPLTWDTLPCPRCKMTPAQAKSAESNLPDADTLQDGTDSGMPFLSQASVVTRPDAQPLGHAPVSESLDGWSQEAPFPGAESTLPELSGRMPPSGIVSAAASSQTEIPSTQPSPPSPKALVATIPDVELVRTGVQNYPFEVQNSSKELTVWCSWCATPCRYQDCRLRSKQKGTWRCEKCNAKCTSLSRFFGTWPTPEFDMLTEEVQADFFKSVRDKTGPQANTACIMLLKSYEKEETYYENGGQFLPLAAWERQGFNIHDIETKSKSHNISQHEVLGTVYRVEILNKGKRGSQGWEKGEQHRVTGKKQKIDEKVKQLTLEHFATSAPGGELPEAEQGEEAEVAEKHSDSDGSSSSSSSSSSSNSSSSSPEKKKKKKKKSKKAMKKKGRKQSKKEKKVAAKKAKEQAKKAAEKAKLAAEKEAAKAAQLVEKEKKEIAKKEEEQKRMASAILKKVLSRILIEL